MARPVKLRVARESLLSKGFVQVPDTGDHEHFCFIHGGRKTKAWTKLSRWKSSDDIDASMFKRMKPQLQLERDKEVEDLLSCDMDYTGYVAKLIAYRVIAA